MTNKTCYLIIEDNDERDLIDTAIRETELGYVRVIAHSLERAKDRFNTEPAFKPDYIFVDWNTDLIKYIKTIPQLAESELIVYTTGLNTEEINEARQIGVTHVVLKTTHDTALTTILLQLFQAKNRPFVMVFQAEEEQSSFRR